MADEWLDESLQPMAKGRAPANLGSTAGFEDLRPGAILLALICIPSFA